MPIRQSNKIHQAKLAVAQDIVALDELRARIGESEDGPFPQQMRSARELRSTEDGRAVLAKKRLLENRLMRLAADPDLRACLTCWMIDFEGAESSPCSDAWTESIADSDFMRAARADYGVVPRLVRTWLEENHFEISDSGSGTGGWHLGVACDDQEAARLCRLAHVELANEMEAGAFTMALKFWGWSLTDLFTVGQAQAFLGAELS